MKDWKKIGLRKNLCLTFHFCIACAATAVYNLCLFNQFCVLLKYEKKVKGPIKLNLIVFTTEHQHHTNSPSSIISELSVSLNNDKH